jgi:DnaD/phage-associated family protein
MSPAESSELLASIDASLLDAILARAHDLAEVKVVLQIARLTAVQDTPRVPLERLLRPESVRVVVGLDSPEPAEDRVLRAIEQAVGDGLLYRIDVRDSAKQRAFLLLASRANRDLLDRLRAGDAGAEVALSLPAGNEIALHRPNAFSLYERHIGPLTPLIAAHLREAERAYPREWLEEAILQSAEYSARSWRYIEAILERWEAEGGPTVTLR